MCTDLLHQRSKSILKSTLLQAYIGFYVTEIIQKGVQTLLSSRCWSELELLYDYFGVIRGLDQLQQGVCDYIVSCSTIITSKLGIPKFIEFIVGHSQ